MKLSVFFRKPKETTIGPPSRWGTGKRKVGFFVLILFSIELFTYGPPTPGWTEETTPTLAPLPPLEASLEAIPFIARIEKIESPNDPVVFNTRSHKIHNPQCPWVSRCTKHCIETKRMDAVQQFGERCRVCGG